MTMRRCYQVTGLLLLIGATLVGHEALQLRYYTSLGPGPGFFPLWLAGALGLLAAAMIAQASFGAPEPMPADFIADRVGYLRLGAVVLALVATVLLLEPLGYRLTMFAVFAFLLWVLGRHGVAMILAVSVAGSFGAYHLFVDVLNVALPAGGFGW